MCDMLKLFAQFILNKPIYCIFKDREMPHMASKCFRSISEIKLDSKSLCPEKHAIPILPSAKTKEKKTRENVNHMLSTAYPFIKTHRGQLEPLSVK